MTNVRLSEEAEQRIEQIKRSYPDKRSAVMPALFIAQDHFGFINDPAVQWVADRIGIAPVHVMEVATFYTMYYKKPVGKFHVQVCRTLSCALRGSKEITRHLHERLEVPPRAVTSNGLWSYEEVECLGSCGTAPMCQINDRYFENLSVSKLEELMRAIEGEHPPLRFSATSDDLGAGLPQYPPSEAWIPRADSFSVDE